MSTPLGYHADPWGRTFGELEERRPIKAAGQQRPKSLWEAIPNDPDYRKYIPIEYRLDAKAIVGYLAQDLQKGKSAHTWVEIAHLGGITAEVWAELFATTSGLIGGLAIAGPFLATAATFLGLGMPYLEAAEEIAKREAASGYSRGVVMGADGQPPRLVQEYFGHLGFYNPQFREGARVAKANHNAGLVAGYLHGNVLNRRKNQHKIFWEDLKSRWGYQSYRGPSSQWSSRGWQDWYTTIAAKFWRDHLTA
jgi:hypothetical protein